MKQIFYVILIILLAGCNSNNNTTASDATIQKVSERKIESTFPFSEAEKVEIISYTYPKYSDIANKDNYDIVNGKIAFNESIIIDRVLLDDKYTNALFNILYTKSCPENYSVADCYRPAHRMIFYDKKHNIIAYLEVCLQCIGYRISPGFTKTEALCDTKMNELETFFKSVGIKHFTDF